MTADALSGPRTAPSEDATVAAAGGGKLLRRLDLAGLLLTLATVFFAIVWAFPLYWAIVTSLKPEFEVVQPGLNLLPDEPTFLAYATILATTQIGRWYVNSIVTSSAVTVLVILMAACCGYALSQLRFPGRGIIYALILASFMVPIQALMITHFTLIADLKLLNTWLGIILPQLIVPVVIIVYKQFFDSIPHEYREAAIMDGANEFTLLFKVYLPMNWGVTTALAIITFIGAWNAFLWPFLAQNGEDMMNITVGITQVRNNFGVFYARELASAVLAGLPVAVAYLLFQRRITQAITLSAGIKG